jgi:hypothetical protein
MSYPPSGPSSGEEGAHLLVDLSNFGAMAKEVEEPCDDATGPKDGGANPSANKGTFKQNRTNCFIMWLLSYRVFELVLWVISI